jgi:glycosyltransferase involved in cell wall biosynthesis
VGETGGDPAYYQSLLTLVQSLNLEQDVNFIGFQKNPFAFLAKSKVFVLSSIYEGLPGVLIQALALGCQLVSTDCQHGPREILDNGKYGKLVPVRNHEAMAKAIIDSINGPNDQSGKKEWSQKFGIKQADEYLKFLNFVISHEKTTKNYRD